MEKEIANSIGPRALVALGVPRALVALGVFLSGGVFGAGILKIDGVNRAVDAWFRATPYQKPSDLGLNLNKLACDLVNSQSGDGSGCYDWCRERAAYVVPTGGKEYGGAEPVYQLSKPWSQHLETGLTDEYSPEIQNACSVVLHGAEY